MLGGLGTCRLHRLGELFEVVFHQCVERCAAILGSTSGTVHSLQIEF
jgi:hypothetical protein